MNDFAEEIKNNLANSRTVLDLIGNTPIVRIGKLNPNKNVNIFAKIEGYNPTGSIKDRIALAMIEDAEKRGILNKDKIIIEPTSGNTGISLAMISAIKGYKIKIVMPEFMSIERRKMLKAFGAELILVKKEEWRDGAIKITKSMVERDKNLVMLNQYENNENFLAHYRNTADEILQQLKPDMFVAGIGTGGTITGVGRRLKEANPDVKIIGVEPLPESKIQGLKSLKEGYVPPILDLSIVDEKIIIEDKDAFETARKLAREEGIFAGISSGAAMHVALKKAKEMDSGTILVIFPDRGEKYLSTNLFD